MKLFKKSIKSFSIQFRAIKLFSIIFVLLLSFSSFAQNFNKIFSIENVNNVTTGTVIIHDRIFVTGYMNDTLQWVNGMKTFIAKFDSNGNLIDYKTFRDSSCLYFGTISAPYVANNKMYVFGYMKDSSSSSNTHPSFHIYLLSIDTNLNARLLLNYVDSTSVYFVPHNLLLMNADKTILLAGSNQHFHGSKSDQHTQPFVLKLDSNGIVKTYTEYPVINRVNVYVKSFLSHDNKLFLTLGGDSIIFLGQSSSHIRPINYLLELDTSCQLLNFYNYSDSNAFATNSTIYLNGKYYGCGGYINTRVTNWNGTGYFLEKPAFFKFNYNFHVISKDSFGNSLCDQGYLKLKLLQNESNLFLVGRNVTDRNSVDSGGINGIISKVDTLGNLIWEHQYRGYSFPVYPAGAHNQFIDVDFLSDGSVIALGNIVADYNAPNNVSQQGWLMRLSPDGCLSSSDCGYETGMNELAPVANEWEHSTNVYPNPSDQFIQLSYQGACSEKMQVEIYSALGQRMLHEEYSAAQTNKRLETAQLQNGIYFYKLYCNYREVGQGKFVVQR